MKKILIVLIGSLLVFSCSKDNKGRVWDANAKVYLSPAAGVKSGGIKTAREIVEQTTELAFYSPFYGKNVGRGFSEPQRDYTNNRLVMWASDIIDTSNNNVLVTFFIEASDLVFVHGEKDGITDTLAYIPNATLRAAEKIIKEAYPRGDYDAVYAAFDNAYKYIPITGAQWRALKLENKQ